jgi:5-formyltetrahydrofolate cyclo-ligase
MDGIVCGSVAVTRDGRRCGKGEGYSDLEYAILRELGHPAAPVATTVHRSQIVERFPRATTDLPLSVIVTPEKAYRIRSRSRPPTGIQWERLTATALQEMPVLQELKTLKAIDVRHPSRRSRRRHR